MSSISAGLSALQAGQRAIEVVGQNITNSATRGYHRQVIEFTNRTVDGQVGTGVEVAGVRRFTNDSIRSAVIRNTGETARLRARLDVQRQAETSLQPGPSSVGGMLESFFNQIEQLTTRPEDTTQRRLALNNADSLANQFRSLSGELGQLRSNVFKEITLAVEDVNSFTPKIADLNRQIAQIEIQGGQPNDLKDQRDQMISQLAEIVDIRTVPQENGVVNVFGANTAFVVSDIPTTIQSTLDANGNILIQDSEGLTNLNLTSGELKGLQEEYNVQIPDLTSRIDSLAGSVIQKLDSIQATGLGTRGPLTTVTGTRAVSSPTVPLANAGLVFPPQAGELRISVTNQTTGARTLNVIAINPATQSLQDVATAINSGTSGQVQASIDPQSNQLRLDAQSGFAFDFAGRTPNPLPTVNMNGTAVPTLSSVYSGGSNDNFTFNVLGNGTIGVTSGLNLEVRNGVGSVVATVNVGEGYNPDAPITLPGGLTLKLSAGTTNNGTFSTPVTAQPDTANLLPALGINGMFTGSNAQNIRLRTELQDDPTRLSLSRSGQPGDISNAERFIEMRDGKFLNGNSQTFTQFMNDVVGSVGSEVQTLSDQQTASQSLQNGLSAQEQATIGVDMNEELVNLLQYQRMVDAASRYLSVVNRALDTIIEIAQ